MRKTRLIILPTKCLNQMGFLLLFLSCPVIGDWGRIRPESEMSQWSIQIDREGSCGLVRDSSGIKNDIIPNGLMDCRVADAALQNNTLPELSQEPDSISQLPETNFERRISRNSRVEVDAERRVRNARRELLDRSSRRSVQVRNIRSERRAVSLDRRTASRNDERRSERMQREVRSEMRDSRERRMSRSLDRRMDARRTSLERQVERMNDNARRLSVSRREREVRDSNVNAARRRIDNARNIQSARLSQSRNDRRVEERRLTRRIQQDERNDARRESERRTLARRGTRQEIERRNSPDFRRIERRERREEERVVERRASNERMNRETSERVNDERMERRIETANSRMDRRNIAVDRRVRHTTEISRRRENTERNARLTIRSERRTMPDNRRIENDLSRKQELSVRRIDKPFERRDIIWAGIRELREKSARSDARMRYEKHSPLTMKIERWEFLTGLKNWFGQKNNEENWVSNHGDFASTCLVGAAVYFLTTRQVKTV